MQSKLDIAIVGSGPTGMAAALFLEREGHRVTLLEKVEDPGPVGAGVLLQPAGMFCLHELGVLQEFLDQGAKIDRLYGVNHKDEEVLNLNYSDFEAGTYGLGIHRGAIFNILHDKVLKSSIEYRTGSPVDHLERQESGRVTLFNKGENVGTYDALVLSDGKNSALRRELKVRQKRHDYKWGALWAIVPDRTGKFQGELKQVYRSTKNIAGMLPIGRHPVSGEASVSLFWSLRKSRLEEWQDMCFEEWKQEVISLYPELVELLNELKSKDDVIFAAYSHIVMDAWHDGNILCIGDAAHAMSPQLGQGVSLGVYDAWTLKECLKSDSSVAEAFADYSRRRGSHIRWMQMMSQVITPMFQSSGSAKAPWRDVVFKAIHSFSFTYRLMLGTLSGVQSGVLRREGKHLRDFLKKMPPL
jgi:2-polyprenyl-6-methoxyphenol hydroxylase-like FAD-dependent oxidoreductase